MTTTTMVSRRRVLAAGAALGALSASGCATTSSGPSIGRVVVVGGGFGGNTAAKYLRLWGGNVDVTLVDRNASFVSCPISNLVLGGNRTMRDITLGYEGLRKHGVDVLNGEAVGVDSAKKIVSFGRGSRLTYDRLVLSPGVDFLMDEIAGYEAAQQRVLHAWKAGPQTVELRRQLEAMPDGGVYVLSIPAAPYRCPPGPYERTCQVAHYFKQAKPRSKVLVLDANPDVTSKGPLFKRAWAELYKDIIEYRPNSKAVDVDFRGSAVKLEFSDVKGDVLNVLPPMKAGNIAAPFITANRRWCEVDWITYESKAAKGVHVLGDSLQIAPAMPKSGTMANGHGKVCAAAIVALLNNEAPNPSPTLINTCYSMVSDRHAIHVASVHKYDEKDRTMKTVPGAGGVSAAMNELEGTYAMSWARNIWADALA